LQKITSLGNLQSPLLQERGRSIFNYKRSITIIFSLSSIILFSQPISRPFTSSWQFSKAGDSKWYKAEVPGTVHTDLLANKLIPDPFYRDNEKKVQWIEKEDWIYRTNFDLPADIVAKRFVQLSFDGLDTYADVFLNGILVLSANNMFRQWKTIELKQLLLAKNNVLQIVFHSAARHDDSLAVMSPIQLAGENNRMYSRKAQYQYGWDWGPRLVTCGIWKTIHWEAWSGDDKGMTVLPIFSEEPINNIRLVIDTGSGGRSFYFTKDGKPVYIKGANWIPCESFLPRAKKLKLYEKLISGAKEANINMLRVWGGGIYEDDIFYDLCDKYGIMVWQDFMFAGALYPADEASLKNIEFELRYQVNRLKHHPCIAIWCGNNEIDEAWHNWGWQDQFHYSANDSTKLWNDYQKIFHQLIPAILKDLDPARPYWPSSPSFGWGREQAYKEGDVHYWGVWWGKEPVEKFYDKVGRFNSEYGMQAFPSMNTIRKFSLPADWDTSSSTMRTHQKHPFGYQNIKLYIENKFKSPKGFENLVYVSQLMQADAIKTAIEAHRSKIPYNMGTMFWQWNDCWPVVSWSAVDYYGGKKALFYEVKRKYAEDFLSFYPVQLVEEGMGASMGPDMYATFFSDKDSSFEVVVSYSVNDFNGKVLSREDDRVFWFNNGVPLKIEYPALIKDKFETKYWLITVKRGNVEIARDIFFNLPPKDLKLPKANIKWKLLPGNRLELITDKFAYGVYIELPDGVETDDNFFHLLPKEKKIVTLNRSVTNSQIKIKTLADTY